VLKPSKSTDTVKEGIKNIAIGEVMTWDEVALITKLIESKSKYEKKEIYSESRESDSEMCVEVDSALPENLADFWSL
jgi:hypothetical protein